MFDVFCKMPLHLQRRHNNDMSYFQWYVFIIHRLPAFFFFSIVVLWNFHIHIRIILYAWDCEWEALMWNSICLTMLVLRGRKETRMLMVAREWGIDWDDECVQYGRFLCEGRRSNLLKYNRHVHDSFGNLVAFESLPFEGIKKMKKIS